MSRFGHREATDEPVLEPVPGRPRPDPGDDFFCIRYQIWYPSFDCAIRTKFRTCSGCLDCEQGRFNLHRHASTLDQLHLRLPWTD